ncbi:MAG: N-acetyltransferase family protein [Chloroflexota bacterium]
MQSEGHVAIRPLRREDAYWVRRINEQILGTDRSETWDDYIERFLAMSKLETMTLPSWGSQVAVAGGRVVGFLLAERQSTGFGLPVGMRLVAIAVHPDFRGQGIGRQLVDAMKEHCKEHGIGQIYSVLQSSDERDIGFLSSCGFETAPVQVLRYELK